MDVLRNLTYQEQLILTAISETTPIPLNDVAVIYKIVLSFDETIAVINEAQEFGNSVIPTVQEIAQKMSVIIDKIEE